MSKVRVQSFAISIDGYAAGPDQDLEHPLGVRVRSSWNGSSTRGCGEGCTAMTMARRESTTKPRSKALPGSVPGSWAATCSAPSEPMAGRELEGLVGRRAAVSHTRVRVDASHARAPLEMAGGTEFHFVTDGIHAALERATAAAGGLDVRVGGGAATVRQYLRAALIDELHLAIRPVLLGAGSTSSTISTCRPWDMNARSTSRRTRRARLSAQARVTRANSRRIGRWPC